MPDPAATGQGLLATRLYFMATFVAILVALILVTCGERKLLARFQNRRGPTRTGPAGFLQSLAVGLKHLAKEDVAPVNADRRVFLVAPPLAFVNAFACAALSYSGAARRGELTRLCLAP